MGWDSKLYFWDIFIKVRNIDICLIVLGCYKSVMYNEFVFYYSILVIYLSYWMMCIMNM